MKEAGQKEERFPITYFDGINATVQSTLAKRSELSHAENIRSPQIGVIEKREGQTVKGTTPLGSRFFATENYGLTSFPTDKSDQQGIFRISATGDDLYTLSISVYEQISINETYLEGSFFSPSYSVNGSETTFQVLVVDYVEIQEPDFSIGLRGSATAIKNDTPSASIFYLSKNETWIELTDPDAQDLMGGQFDFTIFDQNLVLVNQYGNNRFLKKDGTTVITSTDAGSLFNSPPASRTCFYKGRIHLADFTRSNVRYPTTIIRSSFPLGIIALVEGDHETGVTTLNVTDTKYFYAESGMNEYQVYRGGNLIQTIVVTTVNETSLTVNATSFELLSSDEIWIKGTFEGEKQFRWVNNPTSTGRDVKQYDTFRLSGGDEDPITLFETVGNVLMIGNRRSLASWDDYTLQNMDLNLGCSSPNGSVKLLGTLYFADYSGIYATTGGTPVLLSRKVERYIKGATKKGLENAAAGYKGLSAFFAIGDSSIYNEDGSLDKVLSDVCLEYSVADQNWYIHTNMPIKEFARFISESEGEILLGSHEGNSNSVVDFLEGMSDDGKEIFMRADTQELQFLEEFETYANPLAVVTEVYRGSQIKCFVSIDKKDFYALEGTAGKGVSILKINSQDTTKTQPVLCRKIKISYRDSSMQRCRINQSAIVFIPTTLDEPSE